MKVTKIGLVGCGDIAQKAYIPGCKVYPNLEIVACADLDYDRARQTAEKHGIPRALTVDDIFDDEEVEIILNLTVPQAHAPLNLRALQAGKHAYTEKPFAVTWEEGQAVIDLAHAKGLRVGCAPDTFLGDAPQSAKAILDAGKVGKPVGAAAFMLARGHEHWHPSPEFYYKKGGGPLMDMGPYYLTALVSLLGPVKSVSAHASRALDQRTITSEPLNGKVVDVEIPTHLTGLLEFASGVNCTTIFSFDVFGGHHLPSIEIYGTEGTLCVPNPNTYNQPVQFKGRDDPDFQEVDKAYTHGGQRAFGLADMAAGIVADRPHRACGELANHVLEIMLAYFESDSKRARIDLVSTCERPPSLPKGLQPNETPES